MLELLTCRKYYAYDLAVSFQNIDISFFYMTI